MRFGHCITEPFLVTAVGSSSTRRDLFRIVLVMMIESDGATIAYTDDGEGPPVVFLHALGRSASDWSTVIAALSASFRCVAIDFPGHGNSERTGRYQFQHMVTAARDLITELKVGSLSIVAHSMGATVAWILAPEFSDQLTAMVIEDTPVPTGQHEYPQIPDSPPEPVSYDWEARRQIFDNLNHPDPGWRERISSIDAPALLIAGTPDDIEMTETASLLAAAEVVTIPVGHWIHEEAPAEFLGSTDSFLSLHQPTDR